MDLAHIRNFSIIAHIDHGKSTLADRLLEATGTIERRKMREQLLDSMELERERGITIKMQPVRMKYSTSGVEYQFNLIDTPGHIDFSYEVSRALRAVEGVILLVDASQGVQAQTLSVLGLAQDLNLPIIPVINKIDLPTARPEVVEAELIELLACEPQEILRVSGKTGAGVAELLEALVTRIPAPREEFVDGQSSRSLVFDFSYSTHAGVIVYIRVFDGVIRVGQKLKFSTLGETFQVLETGIFSPDKIKVDELRAGEIGYLMTGIKKTGEAKVGETLIDVIKPLPAIAGYRQPLPVVWASIYPSSQDDFIIFRQALERLRLSDASLSFEEESSGALGRGFRCGFLGMLHLEIITERLKREFNLDLIIATPTIRYELLDERTNVKSSIYSPVLFPEDLKGIEVFESWVRATVITPPDYASAVTKMLHEHEAVSVATEIFSGGRLKLTIDLPLRELMRHFFDEIKSVSSGYASLSYEILPMQPADVARLDVLVGDEIVPAFSRIVGRRRIETEAKAAVEKLAKILPRQLITVKIQAKGLGRIIASRTLSAMRKDVTDYLYGGDITRKMKLREKQKKGKKKMQQMGKVTIPPDVFLNMMKADE